MSAAPQSAALLAFPQKSRGLHDTLYTALKSHRVPDGLASALTREAGTWPGYDKVSALACALAARMCPAPIDFGHARAILLMGPCGAGKSTVADKIARTAAAAGRIVERRTAEHGLGSILAGQGEPGALAIINSQGFNPRNMRAAFASLDAAAGLETIGVVSALGDAEEIAEIIATFGLGRVIVTGLDMARRLGALAAAVTGGARIAHVTRGPRADAPLEELAPDALAAMLLSAV